jgi:hypothetical protein
MEERCVSATHLTAEHAEESRQVFYTSVAEVPAYPGRAHGHRRTQGRSVIEVTAMRRASEFQRRKAVTSGVNTLFSDEGGTAAIAFDHECDQCHQRQGKGDEWAGYDKIREALSPSPLHHRP